MEETVHQTADSTPLWVSALHIIKDLVGRRNSFETRAEAKIEHLGQLSPHLLSDIGFAQDHSASSPQRRVWRRGTQCIVVDRDQPMTRVSTAVR